MPTNTNTEHPNQVTCPDCGTSWMRKSGKVPAKGSTWHRTCAAPMVDDITATSPTRADDAAKRATTQLPNPRARREYHASVDSLVAAEELRDALVDVAAAHPANPYVADALARANALVREMDEDLDATMARWTPEEVGL